jgi:hypothetical protein
MSNLLSKPRQIAFKDTGQAAARPGESGVHAVPWLLATL